MSKTPFDASRGKPTLTFFPEELHVQTNPLRPLYQVRHNCAIDEDTVETTIKYGVVAPIIIIRGKDGKPWVTDGTRRWRHAIEANKRIVKAGGEPKKVPCIFRDENETEAEAIKVITNAQRVDLTLTQKAREALAAVKAGYDEKQIAGWFGVGEATISNWLTIAKLHEDARAAIDAGTVRVNDAVRVLGKLSADDQPSALAKLLKAKPTRAAKKADREKSGSKEPVQVSPVRRLKRLADYIDANDAGVDGGFPQELTTVVAWLRGTGEERDMIEAFPALIGFEAKPKKSKAA